MSKLDLQQLVQQAIGYHRAGRLDEADAIYRKVLRAKPANFDALHLSGLVAFQSGRLAEAAQRIQQAVAINPGSPLAQLNLGIVHKQLGRPEQAVTCFRQAIALKPDYAEAYDNLGNVLQESGRNAEAIDCYRRVVTLNPASAPTHYNLGVALKDAGHPEEAATALRQALALQPASEEAHFQLGETLSALGQFVQAVGSYQRALAVKPNNAAAHFALGNALVSLGRTADVVLCYQRGLALDPGAAWAHSNLGLALQTQNRLVEAIASFERAIALDPGYASAHWNLSMARLLGGDFERGWQDYGWRWQTPDNPPRMLSQPEWQGEPLVGETIFLYAEQGLGDTLQFVRYASLVAARGAKVVLEVQPELRRLLAELPGVDMLIARGDPLPPFDRQLPLLSLPRVYGTRLDTIPAAVPYLAADPQLAEVWRERLAALTGLRVGLVWAGSTIHPNDHNRSLDPSALTPFGALPGVSYVSLQKGRAIEGLPAQMQVLDAAPELNDFADTAAALANLDLLITVDTSVAHLAGAMGKPVWLLLPFSPDWRWLLERDDSPWYPSMRLFRQAEPGTWGAVLQQVAEELAALAGVKAPSAPRNAAPPTSEVNPVVPPVRRCKCCDSAAHYFGAVDFAKNCEELRGCVLPVKGRFVPYFRCGACGFLFSDDFDAWPPERFVAEIYNDQYSAVDPDFVARRPAANVVMLQQWFGADKASLRMLDYGGGNGSLAQGLRQAGFRGAESYDPLYDRNQPRPAAKFDLVVSFEVVEHMPHPVEGFNELLDFLSEEGMLLFSTLIQPANIETLGLSWWYAAPRNGHISLHTRASLALLLQRRGLQLTSLDDNLHLAYRSVPAFAAGLLAAASHSR
jgi:tetratricopeptide (TPR) repeat protein/SAM-dependent methyltransferase